MSNNKPVLFTKFRLKSHKDNYNAVGPGKEIISLGEVVRMLQEDKNFLQESLERKEWFAFAPDGIQDRVTSDSEYVVLAKVATLSQLSEQTFLIGYLMDFVGGTMESRIY